MRLLVAVVVAAVGRVGGSLEWFGRWLNGLTLLHRFRATGPSAVGMPA
jgi:hypothetical protein